MAVKKQDKNAEIKKRDRSKDDRIFLGYQDSQGIDICTDAAVTQGYTVYLDEKTNEVFIRRNTSMVHRAPDALFKSARSGQYNFVGNSMVYVS